MKLREENAWGRWAARVVFALAVVMVLIFVFYERIF